MVSQGLNLISSTSSTNKSKFPLVQHVIIGISKMNDHIRIRLAVLSDIMMPLRRVDNLTAPDGLLHTTIWESFIGIHWENAGMLKIYLAGDWINHLSVTSYRGQRFHHQRSQLVNQTLIDVSWEKRENVFPSFPKSATCLSFNTVCFHNISSLRLVVRKHP